MKKNMKVMPERKKIQCKKCGKMVSSANIIKHQKTKKCINYNDKTTEKNNVSIASSAAGSVFPAAPVESKKLIEINLKGEYDKMTETLNPKKKEGKEMKYQCGACGCTFNNLNDGKCPDCGEQLQ